MTLNMNTALADVRRGLVEMRQRAEDAETWERQVPDISKWTVAQQVHHACLVMGFVGMGVRGLLRGRGEEGPELAGPGRDILASGEVPRGVATAPKNFVPDDHPEAAAVIKLLERAEKTWEKIRDRETDLTAVTLRLPHPILGPLSAAEWVRFAGVHTDHHMKIVAEILAT